MSIVEELIDLLFIALLFATVVQPVLRIKIASSIFIFIAIAHDHLGTSGEAYFVSAAMANLLGLILVTSIRPLDFRIMNLGRVLFSMILLNFAGILFYKFNFHYLFYSLPFIILYIVVFFLIALPKTETSCGNTVTDNRIGFSFDRYSWYYLFHQSGKNLS